MTYVHGKKAMMPFPMTTPLYLKSLSQRNWSRKMKKYLLSCVMIFLSNNAYGQIEQDLNKNNEDIIVLGTRLGSIDKNKLTSPAIVITETEIINRGQQYISDLLRTIPGVAVNSSGPQGSLTQVRVRGSEANHVLVLIDGVEMNNPTTGEFDFAGLRSSDVTRIEILKGEQSALYGSDAIGGVINITTRTNSVTKSTQGTFSAGNEKSYEGNIHTIIPIGKASLSLNGTAFKSQGYDISGLNGEKDGSKGKNINLGLNNVNFTGISLSAKFGFSDITTDIDEDADFNGRLNNTTGKTNVKSDTARIDAKFDLAGFSNAITSHMVATDTDTQAEFSSLSKGARHGINWVAKKVLGNNTISFLTEAEHESYSILPNFTEPDAEPEIWSYALAGDYVHSSGPITITASGRHDINDYFKNVTTWRVGAGYKPEELNGRLRASIGSGVKNPSLIELFGFYPTSGFSGNKSLKPENSLGFNIGYEHKIANLQLSVDYFRSELKNEITTVYAADFTSTVINLGSKSTRQGVETEVRWDISEKIKMRSSATYQTSKQNEIEEIRRPKFIASASITYIPSDDILISASLDHNGSQLDTGFSSFQNVKLDAFTLIGLYGSYKVNDNLRFYLRGENLLDEQYQEVIGYSSQGRKLYAGFQTSF